MGAGKKRMLTVFNKVDAATGEMLERARRLVPEGIFASAHSGAGLGDLVEHCLGLIADEFGVMEVFIPHGRYDLVARLHAVGHVQKEEQEDEGVRLRVRVPPAQAGVFRGFAAEEGKKKE